jgi:hypothetical protein
MYCFEFNWNTLIIVIANANVFIFLNAIVRVRDGIVLEFIFDRFFLTVNIIIVVGGGGVIVIFIFGEDLGSF